VVVGQFVDLFETTVFVYLVDASNELTNDAIPCQLDVDSVFVFQREPQGDVEHFLAIHVVHDCSVIIESELIDNCFVVCVFMVEFSYCFGVVTVLRTDEPGIKWKFVNFEIIIFAFRVNYRVPRICYQSILY